LLYSNVPVVDKRQRLKPLNPAECLETESRFQIRIFRTGCSKTNGLILKWRKNYLIHFNKFIYKVNNV
jgi:hypothetical protein